MQTAESTEPTTTSPPATTVQTATATKLPTTMATTAAPPATTLPPAAATELATTMATAAAPQVTTQPAMATEPMTTMAVTTAPPVTTMQPALVTEPATTMAIAAAPPVTTTQTALATEPMTTTAITAAPAVTTTQPAMATEPMTTTAVTAAPPATTTQPARMTEPTTTTAATTPVAVQTPAPRASLAGPVDTILGASLPDPFYDHLRVDLGFLVDWTSLRAAGLQLRDFEGPVAKAVASLLGPAPEPAPELIVRAAFAAEREGSAAGRERSFAAVDVFLRSATAATLRRIGEAVRSGDVPEKLNAALSQIDVRHSAVDDGDLQTEADPDPQEQSRVSRALPLLSSSVRLCCVLSRWTDHIATGQSRLFNRDRSHVKSN